MSSLRSLIQQLWMLWEDDGKFPGVFKSPIFIYFCQLAEVVHVEKIPISYTKFSY